jgi:hypothetical protein
MALMSANARILVPRPGPGYEVQPYGLFKVANGPLDLPPKAITGGLEYETPYCGLPDGYDIACEPGSKAASLVGGWDLVTGDPFTVLEGSACGFGGWDRAASDARTRELVLSKLFAGEQRRVEDIFSRGTFGQARSLAGGGAIPQAASANVLVAFSTLEAIFATTYGLPGMLHVPILAQPAVVAHHLVEQGRDGIWYTPMGTKVVFGNYAGLAPGGGAPAAGSTNIYITAPVNVWRSPEPFVSPWAESVNTTTNQIHRFAEREYVVTYECAAYATETDYTACC